MIRTGWAGLDDPRRARPVTSQMSDILAFIAFTWCDEFSAIAVWDNIFSPIPDLSSDFVKRWSGSERSHIGQGLWLEPQLVSCFDCVEPFGGSGLVRWWSAKHFFCVRALHCLSFPAVCHNQMVVADYFSVFRNERVEARLIWATPD